MLEILTSLTKSDLVEMGDIFGAEIPVRLKRKEMVTSLEDYFSNCCKTWLTYMLERDLKLIKELVTKGPGVSVFQEYPDYMSIAEYYGVVESDDSDGNFKKVWLSEDIYNLVKDQIDAAIEDGEKNGRFEVERIALGFLNLYGVDTFSHFLDFMMDYSNSKCDSRYDMLLNSLKHSPLLKIARFGTYLASPCVSDPMKIINRRKAFKGVKRSTKFTFEDAMAAGKDAPYFTFGLDSPEGTLVWSILTDLGYSETERLREMHNIWISAQLLDKDEIAEDLFISVVRKKEVIHDAAMYNRCVNAIAAYANMLPKWLLKGNSSDEADYLEIVLQDSESNSLNVELDSLGDNEDDKDDFVPDWHLPQPTVSQGYPSIPPIRSESIPKLPEDFISGMSVQHVAPDDPCPCGSGLKYKYCHGKYMN